MRVLWIIILKTEEFHKFWIAALPSKANSSCLSMFTFISKQNRKAKNTFNNKYCSISNWLSKAYYPNSCWIISMHAKVYFISILYNNENYYTINQTKSLISHEHPSKSDKYTSWYHNYISSVSIPNNATLLALHFLDVNTMITRF